ncbi:MAG TPA: carboxypeptidase regulatory-like domain-containing protein [Dongiaceae bacterium]|nr:carboxypeptidase regulatory-like domain-containing protein [Dongiaceae bacterium]
MRVPPYKLLTFAAFTAVILFLVAGFAVAQTQVPNGSLRGQVTDPSGAAISGATILLTTPSGASMDTTTNKDGVFEFKDLAPGNYQIKAVAQGFALFSKDGVAVAAGQVTRSNISLSIEIEKEKVEVNSATTQVDVNPSNNANTITLQGKDLEALSDDPDELQSELQALAGPSAGPNGGQIYIDGFTAGQLPPKASIREIRINQNPFSSEYDKLGYGRVEIFTKPGTDKLHGQFMVTGNTSAFNARNPFEVIPEGESAPDYHSTQYSGNIGGALTKKASFFFNVEQRDIQGLGIISATVLDPDFNIVPYSAAITNPQTRTNISPRIDYQLTPSNTLTGRYQYWRDSETNTGIGQFNLTATGDNELNQEHTFQLTDTQIINATMINEARFQFVHETTATTPLNTATALNVNGAFNGNGSGGGIESDTQNRFEFQDVFYKNINKHAFKFGGRIRSTNDQNSTTSNFNGTFTFGARLTPGCVPTAANDCQITPIEAYQITEQGLANGLTIPQIQLLGGGASYYSQSAGTAGLGVTVVDAGLFFQDDWKLRPNLTISYGLRFETQNNFSDKTDFAPRLGIAWGIGGSAKNPPKTVLRAGFGMFYDRFTYGMLLNQERFNLTGADQQQYLVQNPSFFLSGNVDPLCVPPLPTPPPTQCTSTPITNSATVYSNNNNLHAPYTIQTGVTVERQISKSANIAFTYLNSRGLHQFFTNNINPQANPNDPAYTPPFPNVGNIFQYQSEGTFKQNQLIINGSLRMGAKLSLFGYYTLNYADSDTSGSASFGGSPALGYPSNPFDLQQDWGRAAFDIRNRVFLGGTVGLPKGFRASPFVIVSSGIPFNITTGADPYQDSIFNERPGFAQCASGTQTKYGCFNGNPSPGYAPIPINYGEGPGRFTFNLRLSKTFGFGPVVESSGGQGGGPSGGGTFGRGPGGPRGGPMGGGRGMDAGATNHRYALTLAVIGRNIFNNVNVQAPIGNLSSPQFGESNGLAGRPYGDSTSNRRIDLQLNFTF